MTLEEMGEINRCLYQHGGRDENDLRQDEDGLYVLMANKGRRRKEKVYLNLERD